jgi:hypothetical protein
VVPNPFPRESTPIEETAYSDEQDVADRWGSVGILGGLVAASSLLILIPALQGSGVPSGISVAAIGGLELFFGAFLAYVVHPPAMWATALGGGLTVVEGALLTGGGGTVAWIVGITYLLAGVCLATVGTLRAVRMWHITFREA